MNQWLKNDEAARLVGVDTRTIKRWMQQPATRQALGGVQHGKQWRIPRPDDTEAWRSEARWRLKKCGIRMEPPWKRDLRRIAKANSRWYLEARRFLLAARAKALTRGRITEKASRGIGVLRTIVVEILKTLPDSEMNAEAIKPRAASLIRSRGLPLKSLLRYWPGMEHFNRVRTAKSFEALEALRRSMDYAQAIRDTKRRRQKPTAENLRPLIHKNFMEHANDTKEQLSGIVVNNPTSEQIRSITMASVQSAIWGNKTPQITLDFRQPQNGLAMRTFRERYPREQTRTIEAAVYGIRDSIPDADERPYSGKKAVHGLH